MTVSVSEVQLPLIKCRLGNSWYAGLGRRKLRVSGGFTSADGLRRGVLFPQLLSPFSGRLGAPQLELQAARFLLSSAHDKPWLKQDPDRTGGSRGSSWEAWRWGGKRAPEGTTDSQTPSFAWGCVA